MAVEDHDDAAWAFDDGDAWVLAAAAGETPRKASAVAAGKGPPAPVVDSAVSRTGTLASVARRPKRRLQAADSSPFAADGRKHMG